MGYIPSLQEYLSNAWISSSGPVILLHSYLGTMYQVKDSMDHFLQTYEDLVYNVSLVIRLCNDLGTSVVYNPSLFYSFNHTLLENQKPILETKNKISCDIASLIMDSEIHRLKEKGVMQLLQSYAI